ncbi:hypothetical protein [Nitratireductor sp. L15S-10]|uniref:hypothetical protein n=1 Tax=Nitratireductor sp. L15S-10 TaxID=3034028 RepID=UPI003857CA6A
MRLGGKYLLRLILLAFTAMPVVAITISPAQTASRICKTLEARLAAMPSGSSSKSRNYSRAIAKQQQQLGIVRARMKQAKCGFGIFGNRIPECAQLRKSAASMENNLAKLRRQQGRIGGGSEAQRSRIQARLKANDCYDKGAVKTRKKKQRAQQAKHAIGGPQAAAPQHGFSNHVRAVVRRVLFPNLVFSVQGQILPG